MDVDIAPPTPLTRTGHPRRNYRLPRRFDDFLPNTASTSESEMETGIIQHITLIVWDQFETAADKFGIWRDYPRRPMRDPDASLSLDDLAANPAQFDLPSCSTTYLRRPIQPIKRTGPSPM